VSTRRVARPQAGQRSGRARVSRIGSRAVSATEASAINLPRCRAEIVEASERSIRRAAQIIRRRPRCRSARTAVSATRNRGARARRPRRTATDSVRSLLRRTARRRGVSRARVRNEAAAAATGTALLRVRRDSAVTPTVSVADHLVRSSTCISRSCVVRPTADPAADTAAIVLPATVGRGPATAAERTPHRVTMPRAEDIRAEVVAATPAGVAIRAEAAATVAIARATS